MRIYILFNYITVLHIKSAIVLEARRHLESKGWKNQRLETIARNKTHPLSFLCVLCAGYFKKLPGKEGADLVVWSVCFGLFKKKKKNVIARMYEQFSTTRQTVS